MLYYSFVYPYLLYNIEVWGNAACTYLDPLFRKQKRAVRVVIGASKRAHTEPIFDELKILKLKSIHYLALQTFMYKYYHSKLPNIFDSFFTPISHRYSSRRVNQLMRPTDLKLNIGLRSIRYQGVLSQFLLRITVL